MRLLVVGCGSIGRRHIANLQNLGEQDVLVMEPNPDRRAQVVHAFGVQGFPDLDSALSENPQVVLVCSPNSLHLEQALQAVRAGCHTFVEKPLSHNAKGVTELIREAEAQDLITMVGCNFKFHPQYLKMKEVIDSGVLGRITSARCQFGQYLPDWHPYEDYRKGYSARRDLGGGILLDSHELDYMGWFMGDVAEVFCFSGKISGLEIETEDTAEVLLRFKSGAIGEVHLDYTQRIYQRNFEFFGELGTLSWDFTSGIVRVYLAAEKSWFEYPQDEGYDLNQMYVEQMVHFLECVRNGTSTINDLKGGKKVLDIIVAAKASSSTGKSVSPGKGEGL